MRSVFDIDFAALTAKRFHPSPAAWEDQALYFFMLDRFSDGKETDYVGNDGFLVTRLGTPRYFAPNDFDSTVGNDAAAAAWRDAGGRFVGGTLKGATSKIGYLARLGISAIWVSPVFKQPPWAESYHGYGVQDFLAVEPRFGTADDLRELVSTAHAHGIHVVLDIILNHAGPVFDYDPDRYPANGGFDPRWDGGTYRSRRGRMRRARPRCRFRSPARTLTPPCGRASCRTPTPSRARAASTAGTTSQNSWKAISST